MNRNVKPTNSEIANAPIHTNTEIAYSMRRVIQTFIILYYPSKSCNNLLFYFCKSLPYNLIILKKIIVLIFCKHYTLINNILNYTLVENYKLFSFILHKWQCCDTNQPKTNLNFKFYINNTYIF